MENLQHPKIRGPSRQSVARIGSANLIIIKLSESPPPHQQRYDNPGHTPRLHLNAMETEGL